MTAGDRLLLRAMGLFRLRSSGFEFGDVLCPAILRFRQSAGNSDCEIPTAYKDTRGRTLVGAVVVFFSAATGKVRPLIVRPLLSYKSKKPRRRRQGFSLKVPAVRVRPEVISCRPSDLSSRSKRADIHDGLGIPLVDQSVLLDDFSLQSLIRLCRGRACRSRERISV
jgi:hypothetical protein